LGLVWIAKAPLSIENEIALLLCFAKVNQFWLPFVILFMPFSCLNPKSGVNILNYF